MSEEVKSNPKGKKNIVIIAAVAAIVVVFIVLTQFILPSIKYEKALEYLKDDDYAAAIEHLRDIRGYEDSQDLLEGAYRDYIDELIKSSDYVTAVELLDTVEDDEDLKYLVVYEMAKAFADKGIYQSAIDMLALIAENYEPAEALIEEYTQYLTE